MQLTHLSVVSVLAAASGADAFPFPAALSNLFGFAPAANAVPAVNAVPAAAAAPVHHPTPAYSMGSYNATGNRTSRFHVRAVDVSVNATCSTGTYGNATVVRRSLAYATGSVNATGVNTTLVHVTAPPALVRRSPVFAGYNVTKVNTTLPHVTAPTFVRRSLAYATGSVNATCVNTTAHATVHPIRRAALVRRSLAFSTGVNATGYNTTSVNTTAPVRRRAVADTAPVPVRRTARRRRATADTAAVDAAVANGVCSYPKQYALLRFTTFAPAANTSRSYVSFAYADAATAVATECAFNASSVSLTAGTGLAPRYACNDGLVSFIWEAARNKLTMIETTCPGATATTFEASGSVAATSLRCTTVSGSSNATAAKLTMGAAGVLCSADTVLMGNFTSLQPSPL